MKTLYFECGMGAAGDMLMAALLELSGSRDDFLRRLNSAGIPKVNVTAEASKKCGIAGTRVKVVVDGREEGDGYHSHSHDDNHDGEHHHNHSHENNHGDEHHSHIHENNHDNKHHNHNHDDNNHGNEHHSHNNNHHHHNDVHHSHNSYHEIELLINGLNVNGTVKKNALEVYKILAGAESRAHGVTVDKIHFHEVGEADAVADIVGVCMLIDELAPDLITASPVNLGGGHVRCAHGLLPVPAPATANILQNIPVYSDSADGELCTPTGAALLKHFVREFRGMPLMTVTKTGYGMGAKDFERANCLRAYLGEIDKSNSIKNVNCIDNFDSISDVNNSGISENINEEKIVELACNLDDMTPETVSFAQQLLLDEGALDVYTTSAGMKKSRAGLIFTCLCRLDDREKMLRLIFKHTTTLGIREYITHRYILNREDKEVQTPIGPVRIKTAHGFGVRKSKPEYEDAARIARETGMSIEDVLRKVKL